MPVRVAVFLALAVLTATGFLVFPGHTWLQSDTQIYVPILERLHDPRLFEKEIIAQQPHVSYTLYDETAVWLRWITGQPFETVLAAQQIVFRFCGLLGVYLIASSLGLSLAGSLLVAACYGLGATINGPSVLTIEYEPVPRGSALGLTLLAAGLIARERYLWAGFAAGGALLYHVPAVYPFWAGFLVLLLRTKAGERRSRLRILAPVAAAALVLFVCAKLQHGVGERQAFFTTLDAEQARVMRERASYNWISLWAAHQPQQHLLYWLIAAGAMWRLRRRIPAALVWLLGGAMTAGLLSMPASYLLLEKMQWSLIPQLQPMRALLYITLAMVIFGSAAAVTAAERGRWWEAALWLMPVFGVSVQTRTVWSLLDGSLRAATLTALGLAVAVALVLEAARRWPQAGRVALLGATFSLAWLVPGFSGVKNYPPLHHAELDGVARWARENTPVDAIFLFPQAGRTLPPGVFRAKSLRALYADWKGGGQINFLREFLPLWRPRWEATVVRPFAGAADLERFRSLGITHVITEKPVTGRAPVFANGRYHVYATQ